MKILVIEDKEENTEAAKIQLKEHELTIVTNFDKALDVLTDEFDVVLTDVMIPKGTDRCTEGLVAENFLDINKPMPYGPIIAFRAIQVGIKKIGILTMGNHHNDPFVYAFDTISGFSTNELKVVISNQLDIRKEKLGMPANPRKRITEEILKKMDGELYSINFNRVKDWSALLEKILN